MSSTSFCSSDRACWRERAACSLEWGYAEDTTFNTDLPKQNNDQNSAACLMQLLWLQSPCLQLPAANSRTSCEHITERDARPYPTLSRDEAEGIA